MIIIIIIIIIIIVTYHTLCSYLDQIKTLLRKTEGNILGLEVPEKHSE